MTGGQSLPSQTLRLRAACSSHSLFTEQLTQLALLQVFQVQNARAMASLVLPRLLPGSCRSRLSSQRRVAVCRKLSPVRLAAAGDSTRPTAPHRPPPPALAMAVERWLPRPDASRPPRAGNGRRARSSRSPPPRSSSKQTRRWLRGHPLTDARSALAGRERRTRAASPVRSGSRSARRGGRRPPRQPPGLAWSGPHRREILCHARAS
jgi:hypothetical protein